MTLAPPPHRQDTQATTPRPEGQEERLDSAYPALGLTAGKGQPAGPPGMNPDSVWGDRDGKRVTNCKRQIGWRRDTAKE